jgi:hypothetical protein
VWRLIKEIFTYESRDLTTNLDEGLTYLNRVVKRHAIVFLISDCMDSGVEKSLRLTAKKHDLIVIRVSDPAEEELPDVGLVNLRDPETGQGIIINTRSRKLRTRWRHYREDRMAHLTDLFTRVGVDLVELSTDGPLIEPLTRLFASRPRR